MTERQRRIRPHQSKRPHDSEVVGDVLAGTEVRNRVNALGPYAKRQCQLDVAAADRIEERVHPVPARARMRPATPSP